MDTKLTQIIVDGLRNIPQHEWELTIKKSLLPALKYEIFRHTVGEWTTDDVLDKAPFLTEEKAIAVIDYIAEDFDASVGLDYDSFDQGISDWLGENFSWWENDMIDAELKGGFVVFNDVIPVGEDRNTYIADLRCYTLEEQQELLVYILNALAHFGKC